jgi:hypothetical protein
LTAHYKGLKITGVSHVSANISRILSVAFVVLAALYATTLPARTASLENGRIEGQIVLHPAFGAERAGEPNQRGVQGQVAVVGAAGAVVARVVSDASGRFAVDLPPGRYTLRLTSLRWPAASAPQAATVAGGHITRAVLVLDAGIR